MHTFPFAKSISCLLVFCLLMSTSGCFTYQSVSIPSEDLPRSSAVVATTDGKYYQLAYWEVDTTGKITGIGAEFPSHSEWSRLEGGAPFKGRLDPENVARVKTREVNFLVETTDGKCYRVVSWAIDEEGDFVCRGTIYDSRVQADERLPSKTFRGTLPAVDLKPIEIESFSLPRTLLFLAGVGLCALGVAILVFAATYEHG